MCRFFRLRLAECRAATLGAREGIVLGGVRPKERRPDGGCGCSACETLCRGGLRVRGVPAAGNCGGAGCGSMIRSGKSELRLVLCVIFAGRGSFGVGRGCPGAADRIRCSPRPPHLFAARLRRGSSLSAGRSEVGSAGGHASIAPEIRRLWIVLGFRDYCLSLPLSGEPTPFDETTLVCKIGGRMYACADRAEFGCIAVECDPGAAIALRERYAEAEPACHFNKKHWTGIRTTGDLPHACIREQIRHSCLLVLEGVTPRARREEIRACIENRDCPNSSPDSFRPVSRPVLRGKPRHTPARGSSVVPTAYWGLSCAGMPLSAYPFVASFLARPAWMRFRSGVSRLRFSKCLPPRCILVADRFCSVFAFIYSPCTASPGADSAAFRRRDGFHTLRPCLRRAGPQRCQNNR